MVIVGAPGAVRAPILASSAFVLSIMGDDNNPEGRPRFAASAIVASW